MLIAKRREASVNWRIGKPTRAMLRLAPVAGAGARGAVVPEFCLACGEGGGTLRCDACKFVFHAQCAGISAESLPPKWMCTRCRHAAASNTYQARGEVVSSRQCAMLQRLKLERLASREAACIAFLFPKQRRYE